MTYFSYLVNSLNTFFHGKPLANKQRSDVSFLDLLGEDVLELIFHFLSNFDIIQLSCCCHNTILKSNKARLLSHSKQICETFPVFIIGALHPKVFWNMHFEKYNPMWLGSTGYFDRVSYENTESNLFWSRDQHDRLLIVMMDESKNVVVLFQRYSNNVMTWTFASRNLPIGGNRLDMKMQKWLEEWCNSL